MEGSANQSHLVWLVKHNRFTSQTGWRAHLFIKGEDANMEKSVLRQKGNCFSINGTLRMNESKEKKYEYEPFYCE